MTDTAPERTEATGNGVPASAAPQGRCADRDREAAVFARIEAFRRRRPRLRDEVITLAHGAGGKASAALLDAVFLPAFAPHPIPTHHDAAETRPPLTDAAVLGLPAANVSRSAPTPTS